LLSAVTVLFGIALFFARRGLRNLAGKLSPLGTYGPTHWYQEGLRNTMKFANYFTRILQNGRQRSYILLIFISTIILLLVSYNDNLAFLTSVRFSEIFYYEWIIAALIVVASVAVIRSRSRLGGVASLGVIGYSIALLFVFYGAPDLAITQILVETLIVVLFVFVIYHLPRFVNLSTPGTRIRDILISVLFGGIMTLLVLKTVNVYHPPLSDFFGQNSFLKAFGKNVVNVILVDFRALDTLGEITVLSAAALGVYALLKLRTSGEENKK
jgi:multicomponent Na+:H+ antiporter subunit A